MPGPLRCDVVVEGFSVAVDEPAEVGGTDLAPQPTDFFLVSAASCFALSMVYSAGKHGVEFDRLRVDAVGHYKGTRFDSVRIEVYAEGAGDADMTSIVEGAQRVCYVTNTIREGAAVDIVVKGP